MELHKLAGHPSMHARTQRLKVQHSLQLCMLAAPFITASLAQLAEHALRKRMVVGSIPTGGWLYFTFLHALGQRYLWAKIKVTKTLTSNCASGRQAPNPALDILDPASAVLRIQRKWPTRRHL